MAGVAEGTGREWLSRGLGTHSDRPDYAVFAEFAEAIKKAEFEFKQDAIANISKAAKGSKSVRVKEGVDRNGEPIIETSTETRSSWQAAAWLLERKYPQEWGAKRMTELEALKVLADAGWIPQAVVEAAIDGFSDTRTRVQASLSALSEE